MAIFRIGAKRIVHALNRCSASSRFDRETVHGTLYVTGIPCLRSRAREASARLPFAPPGVVADSNTTAQPPHITPLGTAGWSTVPHGKQLPERNTKFMTSGCVQLFPHCLEATDGPIGASQLPLPQPSPLPLLLCATPLSRQLPQLPQLPRAYHTSIVPHTEAAEHRTVLPVTLEGREEVAYDVIIVGAGPAGLSAAIRVKQLCPHVSVCVLEKGNQPGSHILSGNVFEPRALYELFEDLAAKDPPLRTLVTRDRFCYLATPNLSLPLPSPSSNHGNFVISLSELVRWLASEAECLGVDIFPGISGAQLLMSDSAGSLHLPSEERRLHGTEESAVVGIVTGDVGVGKDGKPKDTYQKGMILRGQVTLLAEGCRGSLSEDAIARYALRRQPGIQHQTYALGVKEVWQVDETKHRRGEVLHTVGYPLDTSTYGGGFLYHMDKNLVSLGLVVALDYKNPHLNIFQEFQRWKLHPIVNSVIEGGTVVQYGARTLNEGGYQSIPRLIFPGGALIGCSAGFVNVPKIKGTHTAMKSGMLAAEAVCAAFGIDRATSVESALAQYPTLLESSWVWEELKQVRNVRPGFKYGQALGILNSAFEIFISRGRSPWTLSHGSRDNEAIVPITDWKGPVPEYPKPDGKTTFDVLTSVYRSSTNHSHDEIPHLKLLDSCVPRDVNLTLYGGPESKYCPAKVYEYVPSETTGEMELVINAQNCVHCKACDIKDPNQNIRWTPPEGGGGPGYTVM